MNPTTDSLRELVAFYRDAGVDALLVEEPVDRFAGEPGAGPSAADPRADGGTQRTAGNPADARSDPVPERQPLNRTASAPADETASRALPVPQAPDVAIMAARDAAKSAGSLDELRALLDAFEGCMLRATATQLVFAAGTPKSRVMFVGEAPGRDEDLSGVPFVGRSGQLLDRMMAAIGLDRSSAYIANVVPWRPPGNRTPTPQETAICLPFIRRQIELADPDFLICLGQPATQTLLGTREGISRTRGRWFKFDTGSREIRALPTYHPAFLLRSPLQKRLVWRDFLSLKKALSG